MVNLDFSKISILVIGDVMLDKYYFGKVERISPEAPVPIVKVENSRFTLGGAGNVANNLAHLGANTYLLGITGADDDNKILRGLLSKVNINSFLIETDLPTITKVRVVGGHQQIARLDFEEIKEIQGNVLEKIKTTVDKLLNEINGIVLSDYGKGVCSPELCEYVIEMANKKGLFVIVDPHGENWDKYKNATIVTPNVKELGEVVGKKIKNTDEEIERFCFGVRRKYNLKYLLVTRSEKGMSLILENNIHHIPTVAKEVFDVSGAGDTVVATLSASMVHGKDILLCTKLANRAAGIVVSKIGTAPIEYDELLNSFNDKGEQKILNLTQMQDLLLKARMSNKKIVFSNGCFDILHKGHITYLKEAKNMGDILIIGLNGDDSVKRLKGINRPINNQVDRAAVLSGLNCVDYIIIFDEDTPYNLIKIIKPDVLVKGGDYKVENVVGREFAKETVIVPFLEGYSTSRIINVSSGNYVETCDGADSSPVV